MDLNYQAEAPAAMKKLDEASIKLIREKIRECVVTRPDPNGPTIHEFCEPLGYPREAVSRVMASMIEAQEIRQKEDSFEHDWVYRQGRNW